MKTSDYFIVLLVAMFFVVILFGIHQALSILKDSLPKPAPKPLFRFYRYDLGATWAVAIRGRVWAFKNPFWRSEP